MTRSIEGATPMALDPFLANVSSAYTVEDLARDAPGIVQALADCNGPKLDVGLERLRSVYISQGVTFVETKDSGPDLSVESKIVLAKAFYDHSNDVARMNEVIDSLAGFNRIAAAKQELAATLVEIGLDVDQIYPEALSKKNAPKP